MIENKPLDTFEQELLAEITSLNARIDAHRTTNIILGVVCSLLFMFAAVSSSLVMYLLIAGIR